MEFGGGIFPGWIRPGLIEATVPEQYIEWWTAFPGWIRPGLIEAAATICAAGTYCPPFRGGSAPASLKQAVDFV